MKALLGVALIIAGISAGLYVGIWWGFIGGITAIIEAAKAPELIPTDIAYAVARIIFCQFLGVMAGALLYIPGLFLVTLEK